MSTYNENGASPDENQKNNSKVLQKLGTGVVFLGKFYHTPKVLPRNLGRVGHLTFRKTIEEQQTSQTKKAKQNMGGTASFD